MTKPTETHFWVTTDGVTLSTVPNATPASPVSVTLRNVVFKRGDTFTVTSALIEATRDLWGNSVYADLTPEAQTARWGSAWLEPGEVHDDVLAELADEAAAEAEALRIAKVRQAHQYGKKRATEPAYDTPVTR
ncbi:MAG: hypothetical protein JWO18_2029 [Microbacteriaceae bacterium]|nr:hypothetical protein [Microbacteriaceae bacterium]